MHSEGLDVLSDVDFGPLATWIFQSAGLSPLTVRQSSLAQKIAERMSQSGYKTCWEYGQLLRADELELERLVASLSVGESYFFRNPEQFQALTETVFPSLAESRGPDRGLAIWSAGCSIGPEPYSLAIHVSRSWEYKHRPVEILGTDLNHDYLEVARQGIYTKWDLRGMDANLTAQCFSQRGSRYVLREPYRNAVTFRQHSLLSEAYPHPSRQKGWDLIVCRNVLIYLDREAASEIVAKFWEALDPGGWLMLGPVECVLEITSPEMGRPLGGSALFYKGKRKAVLPQAAAPEAKPRPKPTPPPVARKTPAESSEFSLDPIDYFKHAVHHDLEDNEEEADRMLARALFLDHRHVPSHYYRGLLRQRRGQRMAARKSFESARRLIDEMPPETTFPEWEGIQLNQLGELVTLQLERLGETS